jgi:hypothetical protein
MMQIVKMFGPDDIRAMVRENDSLREMVNMISPDAFSSMSLPGIYPTLLSELFCEKGFSVITTNDVEKPSVTVVVNNRPASVNRRPLFICVVLSESQRSVLRAQKTVRDKMFRFLQEADTPLSLLYGLCVCGTRGALFQYERGQSINLPDNDGGIDFDLDFETEVGARVLLEVVGEVKDMLEEVKETT